tara:strand:- start:3959 stop:4327 length:369 start_codon:yes stop_codon:yes gene_type:complete
MTILKEVLEYQKKQTFKFDLLKKEITAKLCNKIRFLASKGDTNCIFNVPPYVFGYPRYKVFDLTIFLFKLVNNEGFNVNIIKEDQLFISWNLTDLNKKNNNVKLNNKSSRTYNDLKPLLNIK